ALRRLRRGLPPRRFNVADHRPPPHVLRPGADMLTFDWHLDLAWNALEWNRDLTLPVAEIRRREVERGHTGPGRGTNTVSLPALRDGHIAVASATILARHDRDWRPLGFIPKSG